MSQQKDRTCPDLPPSEASETDDAGVNRRSLLIGSAGLTLGSVLSAPPAFAQHRHGSAAPDLDSHEAHGSASLSNRIYSVNPVDPDMADIAENPINVPPPITRKEPTTVQIELETIEIEAHLDYNTSYRFWTFDGTVPGPFQRVRVGDTVEVTLKNNEESWYAHNIDLHAVIGPGGGAEVTTVGPGETRRFRFKALHPGLYMYHCAVPPVALHIANGMYGMILVEPEEGLPPVDREFYVMQGEIYTEEPFGSSGTLNESYDKLLDERAEYVVFNGHVGSLTEHYPMRARVGETIRIFLGSGGPNYTASLHLIGKIFDRAYLEGSLTSEPLKDVQMIKVAPGGTGIVEFTCRVPGRYVLVDHALSRAERGLAAYLYVEGEPNPEIFTAIDANGDPIDPHQA